MYGTEPREQANASRIAEINRAKRAYQKGFLDYWMSTAASSPTGRPIDGLIAPVAPFPAALPGKFTYYNYTTFVNILDYTSCVIPVTTVDKKVDLVNQTVDPLSDIDAQTAPLCKLSALTIFVASTTSVDT